MSSKSPSIDWADEDDQEEIQTSSAPANRNQDLSSKSRDESAPSYPKVAAGQNCAKSPLWGNTPAAQTTAKSKNPAQPTATPEMKVEVLSQLQSAPSTSQEPPQSAAPTAAVESAQRQSSTERKSTHKTSQRKSQNSAPARVEAVNAAAAPEAEQQEPQHPPRRAKASARTPQPHPRVGQPTRCVVLKHVPFSAEEGDVRAAVSAFGEPNSVRLIRDSVTGQFNGKCFVTFQTVEEASAATAASGKLKVNGKSVKIEFAAELARPGREGGKRAARAPQASHNTPSRQPDPRGTRKPHAEDGQRRAREPSTPDELASSLATVEFEEIDQFPKVDKFGFVEIYDAPPQKSKQRKHNSSTKTATKSQPSKHTETPSAASPVSANADQVENRNRFGAKTKRIAIIDLPVDVSTDEIADAMHAFGNVVGSPAIVKHGDATEALVEYPSLIDAENAATAGTVTIRGVKATVKFASAEFAKRAERKKTAPRRKGRHGGHST